MEYAKRYYNNAIILAALIWCLIPITHSQGRELHFVNEHWPPYIIANDNGPVSGIDVEILKLIADVMDLDLKIEIAKWVHCLRMMKNGRADIISAILRRPDREKYMHYIEPAYLLSSTKLFYLNKTSRHEIRRYEDVYGLRIGILKGSAYFSPFDDDPAITKVAVPATGQLVVMLKSNRLDAFIGTEVVTDWIIRMKKEDGVFRKSTFRHEQETPFHFAISKKSPRARDLPKFNRALKQLIQTGAVKAIFEKYGIDEAAADN